MASPVILTNTLTPGSVNPGQSAVWRTVATDPDVRSSTVTRPVTDSTGNVTLFTATMDVTDPLTYGVPTSPDPKLSFVVDPTDATKVTITVSAT